MATLFNTARTLVYLLPILMRHTTGSYFMQSDLHTSTNNFGVFLRMGGGHGETVWKCPDWRQYKVEEVPELMEVQKRLAEKGLKSPWLRNEVWRFYMRPDSSSHFVGLRRVVFRGFKPALAATIITVLVQKYFLNSDDGHH